MSSPEPLGVTLAGDGVNVAVASTTAEAIWFCVFDQGAERRVPLTERTGDVWHAHVPGVAAGALYGLRADGKWDPAAGHRFNAAKLLLDPHALSLDRVCRLHPAMFGQDSAGNPDPVDSAPFMPRCVVMPTVQTSPVVRPATPWGETVIYELHVRGFSKRHPEVPDALRGTFAGLAHPACVQHLVQLGVTAVELMPTAAWIEERHLAALGLTNYWGYNPVAFAAPDLRLASGGWAEIRAAVAALADAGIETLIDVVLNHSGEGDALGPTLSLRGLDNGQYYRLHPDGSYVDDTGCGNTLALDRPHGVRLAMDALRSWATLGGVHGFRFDLGTILGRREDGFDAAAPLLTAISQDPVLRDLKLISEPWDVGWGGYRLGAFPGGWGEWNDRFRDATRRFWRGDSELMGELATRFAGSADLLGAHRRPSRGVNFVVAHDGFTLADLVSHTEKHNAANGEDNRDGSGDNHSWNNGMEGASADPGIVAARRRDQAALLGTLLLARGTPMLAAGSELGQSQGGNNNAYCQDNNVTWLDWAAADPTLLQVTTALVAARRRHPALRNDRFLVGDGDVAWRRPDGEPMQDGDWPEAATLVVVLTAADDQVVVVLHRGDQKVAVALPPGEWRDALTGTPAGAVPARSVTLFERT